MDPNSGRIYEVESDDEARQRGLVPLPNRAARRAMKGLTESERADFCAGLTIEQVAAKLRDKKALSAAQRKARRKRIRSNGGQA